jgi:hypothetical protein
MVHGHLTGQLSGIVTSDTIGHDEHLLFLANMAGVLVFLSSDAYIGIHAKFNHVAP